MTAAQMQQQGEFGLSREVLGDSLVVSACFVSCLGVNLQKKAHLLNESLPVERRRAMVWDTNWWMGVVLMAGASAMDLAALPLIPLSRVAALGATTLVANVLVTPWFQNENLTKHDVIGCLITLLGSSTACFYGTYRQPELTSELLLALVSAPSFIAYSVMVVASVCGLFYFISEFRNKEADLKKEGLLGGPDQPDALECVWAAEKGMLQWGPQFYPTVHAAYAGVLGGHSIMFAKAALALVYNVLLAPSLMSSVLFVGSTLLAVCCVWSQIYFLNRALQIYKDVLYVLPVYQSFWVVSGVASGLIFYQEYTRMPPLDFAMFSAAVVVTLSGLAVLGLRKPVPAKSSKNPKTVQ